MCQISAVPTTSSFLLSKSFGSPYDLKNISIAPDLVNVTTIKHQESTASPTIKLYINSSYSHIKLKNLDFTTTKMTVALITKSQTF